MHVICCNLERETNAVEQSQYVSKLLKRDGYNVSASTRKSIGYSISKIRSQNDTCEHATSDKDNVALREVLKIYHEAKIVNVGTKHEWGQTYSGQRERGQGSAHAKYTFKSRTSEHSV